ncbi:hypothetical protein ACA910_015861 [Epithemia clementina (nom. ined.)]
MSGSTTITLKAEGPRESVDETKAKEIANQFQEELSKGNVIVTTVDLSCRSWSRSSLDCLRAVLEQVVETVTILKIDDIIASLDTEAGLKSLEFFTEVFGTSKVLKEINLNDNALGSRGDKVLAPLFQLKSLERLSIENCGMSQEVAESLLQSLALSAPTLTDLSLGRNQIGAEGARHVGALLTKCCNLQVFNYNGCRPLKAGTAHVLKGLARMVEERKGASTITSLIHLNLHDCTIGSEVDEDDEEGGSPLHNLVTIISNSPKLQVLNLQDGEIGAEGVERVLDALKGTGASLTYLALGGCDLGEDGAQLLSLAITESTIFKHLETLRMDTNELGDEGVIALVQALAEDGACPKLHTLDLETNEISKSGALAMISSKIPSLQSLNVTDNMEIPAQAAAKLQKLYPQVQVDEDLETDDKEEVAYNDAVVEGQVDDLADQLANATI